MEDLQIIKFFSKKEKDKFRNIEPKKRCVKCGERKPYSQFNKDSTNSDGLDIYCKKCQRKRGIYYRKKWKEKNKKRDVFNPSETKICPKCNRELPKTKKNWCKQLSRPKGLTVYCRTCLKYRRRKQKYNLSSKKQESLFKSQNSKCAICGESLFLFKAHLDHNHKTGKVRGFLCKDCNLLLGRAKDNPLILAKAITYLKEN